MSKHYRDQFEKRFSAFQIPKSEIDRMYERDLDFQMHLQWMAEQALANQQGGVTSSPAGGGAAVGSTPTPLTGAVNLTLVYWQDSVSSTWKYRIYNHDNNTLTDTVDLGLDPAIWNAVDDSRILQSSGFVLMLQNNVDTQQKVYFINPSGEIVELVNGDSAFASSLNTREYLLTTYYYMDGVGITFYAFDGETVRSRYFSGGSTIQFNTGGGEVSLNRAFSVEIDSTTTYIGTPDGTFVDVTSSAGDPVFNSWTTCFQAQFLVSIKTNSATSLYDEVIIFNEDGTVKNTLDLSAYNLDNLQNSIYGTNNWMAIGYDSSIASSPWVIVKYNFTNDQFSILDTYTRDVYNSRQAYRDFRETIDSFDSSRNNLVIRLSQTPAFNVWGDLTDYLAVVWSLGDGPLVSEVVANGVTYEYNFPSMYSDNPTFLVYPAGASGAVYIETAILGASAITFSPTGQVSSTCTSVGSDNIGDTTNALRLFSASGLRWEFWDTALIDFALTSGNSFMSQNGSAAVVIDQDNLADSFTFTEASGTITPTPVSVGLQVVSNQYFGTLDGIGVGKVLLYDQNVNGMPYHHVYVVNNDQGVIGPFAGNTTNAANLDLGETTFTWDFEDPSTSNRVYRMMSLSDGSVLSEFDTGVNLPNSSNVYGDRCYALVNDVSTSTIFLGGIAGSTSFVVDSTNVSRAFNDTYWAD